MAKIKVSELREAIKKDEKEDIRTFNYNGINLEIKQYIPILEKITFADTVYKSAVDTNDGLHIVKGNVLDIAFKVVLIETYTNITLPQHKDDDGKMTTDIIQSYDMLISSELYNTVYGLIPEDEILDLKMALDNHIFDKQCEYDQRNTIADRELRIENIIKDGISGVLVEVTKLIDKLPEKDEWGNIMKDIPQSLDGLFSQIKEGSKQLDKEQQEYLTQLTNTVIGDMARGVMK